MGEIAKRYQQIIERLTQEGLIHKNKLLPTPFDIQNVLVIAPQNAAGLGDFKKMQMHLSEMGFVILCITPLLFKETRLQPA